MESSEAYLERKHQELRLLNDCLRNPLPLPCPRSLSEVIKHKFQLAAALKAEHALQDWTATETAWSQVGHPTTGPFEFRYDYQRADLEVQGPSLYELRDGSTTETIYTASGMAAISALLFASGNVIGRADILVLPGSYGETMELVGYVRPLRLVTLNRSLDEVGDQSCPRIFLLDSCTHATTFQAALGRRKPAIDLLIFDTTGFASSSGRIRRALQVARKWEIPTVMVRSHTKLDSLGVEYGRLGSATFVHWEKDDAWASRSTLKSLPRETRNAVRLLGGAALPAHFPPFVGTPSYRISTNKRVAAILRNGRRASRYLESELRGLTAELHFAHGLYVTLKSTRPLEEETARRAAAKMSDELSQAGFPIRHAGSFGFDFAATEWFHDLTTDCYSVRIAVPDLPTALWDDLTNAIAQWWKAQQGAPACGSIRQLPKCKDSVDHGASTESEAIDWRRF
jgi:hypothetical protein